jgi:arsenite methyltransferase
MQPRKGEYNVPSSSKDLPILVTEVQQKYGAIARGEASGCCGPQSDVALALGYSESDLALAKEANLGLGCGNPLALAEIQPGMTVLDLGSGAGFDAFLVWNRVGPTGRVIGVDMTDDMLAKAHANAEQLGATNVEFRKGYIEELPVDDRTIDLVISNCVINLSTDKPAVFREIYRVLKPGGRFAVSDIVLLADLPEAIARDVNAYVGCVAGASRLGDYLSMAYQAGLENLAIPQITPGTSLVEAYVPTGCSTGESLWSPEEVRQAASCLASVKLHGGRPGQDAD